MSLGEIVQMAPEVTPLVTGPDRSIGRGLGVLEPLTPPWAKHLKNFSFSSLEGFRRA